MNISISSNDASVMDECPDHLIDTDQHFNQKGKHPDKMSGLEMIDKLRNEPFNLSVEERLQSHPYIKAAEDGTLTIAQRHAFVREQYSILHSMSISLSSLAGDVPSGEGEEEETDLFQFLLDGVEHIAKLLDAHAKSLGVDEETLKALYPVLSKCETYHAYWSFLALSNKRAAAAAACAVNFPAWGQVCGRLLEAFGKEDKYDSVDDDGLAFLKFHSTPIEGLDEMAASIIEKKGTSYEDLVEHVRLLQEFEVMFWDGVFEFEGQGQSK
jgi:pyrroloquinoline quinone (PQQ) biosynthesis protein C